MEYKRVIFLIKSLFVPFEGNNYEPKFIKSKFLLYFALFIFILKIAIVALFIPLPQNVFFADLTKIGIVKAINENRINSGLNPLNQNEKLDEAALLKAYDMISKGYFSHQSPGGVDPWYWFSRAGYDYKYAGENLAVGFTDSSTLFNAWVGSPSHRDNILNPNYQEVGTAVLDGFQNNAILVVQLFGSPQNVAKPVAVSQTATSQLPKNPNAKNEENSKVQPVQPVQPIVSSENVLAEQTAQNPQVKEVLPENNKLAPGHRYQLVNYIAYANNVPLKIISISLLLAVIACFMITLLAGLENLKKRMVFRHISLILIFYFSAFLLNIDVIYRFLPYNIVI
ncbi:MAG: CAP domain-containing protein [Patescibacteria group bacterium]